MEPCRLLVLALACLGPCAAGSQCGRGLYGITDPTLATAVTIPSVHFTMRYYETNIQPQACQYAVDVASEPVGVHLTVCPEYSSASVPQVTVENVLQAVVSAASDTVVYAVLYCSPAQEPARKAVLTSRRSFLPLGFDDSN